jgi:hypothetical protein
MVKRRDEKVGIIQTFQKVFNAAFAIMHFCKELIFVSEDEHDFMSWKFSAKKALIAIIVMISLSFNSLMFIRAFSLAKELNEYKVKLNTCEKIHDIEK